MQLDFRRNRISDSSAAYKSHICPHWSMTKLWGRGCKPHPPVVDIKVAASKVNAGRRMVGREVLPSDGGPACARICGLSRAVWAVESLLTHSDHVLWVEALQVRTHLLNPPLHKDSAMLTSPTLTTLSNCCSSPCWGGLGYVIHAECCCSCRNLAKTGHNVHACVLGSCSE